MGMPAEWPAKTEAEGILALRSKKVSVGEGGKVGGRPFPATYSDMIDDVLDDKQCMKKLFIEAGIGFLINSFVGPCSDGSALHTLEAFITERNYPPSSQLSKVLSICVSDRTLPWETGVQALALLHRVLYLHGSEPFRPIFIQTDVDSPARLWEMIRDAWGFWNKSDDEAHSQVQRPLARPVISFLVELIGLDLATSYQKGRYRKVNYRVPLDVISEILDSPLVDSSTTSLVAHLIHEISLLAMTGHTDLTNFLRELISVLKELDADELLVLLEHIPSDSLRLAICERLLDTLCIINRRSSSHISQSPVRSASSAVPLMPILRYFTVTSIERCNWETVVRLVQVLLGSIEVETAAEIDAIREAAIAFAERIPKNTVPSIVSGSLKDCIKIMWPITTSD
ncbi:hypothetical protein DFJ77DRAFT_442681 [Powellomyces hirtus]|nr:hypothetical protein DFJ77DRAFT_442681 [Powellomyces hirtus]